MTTHYLGLKSSDSPELAGADFTEDVDFSGKYGIQLQNVPDLISKQNYWFDGVNDYLTKTDDKNLDITSGMPFSFLISGRVIDNGGNRILASKRFAGNYYMVRFQANNKLALLWNDGTGGISEGTVTDQNVNGNYHTWVLTRSGTDLNFFLDGKLDITNTITMGDLTNTNSFQIGIYASTNYPFDGSINTLKFFNITLSETEVKSFSSGISVPFKYIGASQTPVTTGSFVVGKAYRIVNVGDTDFTLIGASANTIGVEFVTTGVGGGTTGTATQIGCVLNLNSSGIGHNQWIDSSGNNLHGTVSGALPTNLPTNHVEKVHLQAQTSDFTFTCPMGYKIKAITIEETAGNAITGGLNIGSSAGGAQVVSAEAIGVSSTVNCTLLQTFFSTDTDQTIYVSDVTSWNFASIDLYCWMERIIA